MPVEAKTCVFVGRLIGLHQDRAFVPQGIFTGTDAKAKAEAVCKDEWYFCVKLDLNKDMKLADMPWSEIWKPVKPKK